MFSALHKKYDSEITKYWDSQVTTYRSLTTHYSQRENDDAAAYCSPPTYYLLLTTHYSQRENDDAAAYDEEIVGEQSAEEEEASHR
eukprot:scaffold18417_cov39-Phaeocystis_antarctica.AAC.3